MDVDMSKSTPKRKYFPKSKTGCSTCKARRVKCDEARPFCRRCTGTGRKCDGYGTETHGLQLPPSSHSNLHIGTTAVEMFEFFVVETVPCLSGFFGDEFWSKSILQYSESDSVIGHAINAVAALHKESYLQRVNARARYPLDEFSYMSNFAAQEYTVALTGLRTSIDDGSVSLLTVLVSAALFVHYEFLRGAYISGIMHKNQSATLLKLAMQSQEDEVDQGLVSTLCQIDLQASLLSCAYVPMESRCEFIVPKERFSTPMEAKHLVNKWTCKFYRFVRTSVYEQRLGPHTPESDDPKAKSRIFADAFETIHLLLEDYKSFPRTKLSLQEHKGLMLLQVRTKINQMLAACCSSDERIYDTFKNDFEDILATISYVMKSSNLQKLTFTASFDEGLLHPLDFVASKCRDHGIRHRALDLITGIPNQTGMWHAIAMVRCAQRVVQYEESEESILHEPFLGLDRKRVLNNHVLAMDPMDPGSTLRTRLIVWPVSPDGASAEFEEDLCW